MNIVNRQNISQNRPTTTKNIFTSKIFKIILKKYIKTYIWSIAFYGCETWTMTKKEKKKIFYTTKAVKYRSCLMVNGYRNFRCMQYYRGHLCVGPKQILIDWPFSRIPYCTVYLICNFLCFLAINCVYVNPIKSRRTMKRQAWSFSYADARNIFNNFSLFHVLFQYILLFNDNLKEIAVETKVKSPSVSIISTITTGFTY